MTDQAMEFPLVVVHHPPWNKDRIIGQKAPFKLKEICVIRAWLDLEHNDRDRALLDVAIDSKMRGGDVTRLRVDDLSVTATRLPHGPASGKARRNVR